MAEPNIENSKDTGMTVTQRFIWIMNVVVSIVICYYVLHMLCTKQYTPIILQSQSQHQFLGDSGNFLICISIILMVFSMLADGTDEGPHIQYYNHNNINGRVSMGQKGVTADLHRCFKNIVNNTILWTVVFLIFYINGRNQLELQRLQHTLLDLFIVGRLVFSIGYILGVLIGHQSLRSLGFGFTISCVVIALGEAAGHSITDKFS